VNVKNETSSIKRIPTQVYLTRKMKKEVLVACLYMQGHLDEYYSESRFHREATEMYLNHIAELMKNEEE